MKILRKNGNWNKINTREELLELLKKYNRILSGSMIHYLNGLVDLEFSVIKDNINVSDDDRKVLSELEVYKRIAMYNIYNMALNIFEKANPEIMISGNNDGIEGLNVYASFGERSFQVFDFYYQEGPIGFELEIPSGYKTMRIGDISLFHTMASDKLRESELMRVMDELDRLYDQKNPYGYSSYGDSRHFGGCRHVGGPAAQWSFEHNKKIKANEKRFELLDSKKELTDDDKREIEITNRFYELLLKDYGLTDKDFEEEDDLVFPERQTKLQKTLVKKTPNIKIYNNIKYI